MEATEWENIYWPAKSREILRSKQWECKTRTNAVTTVQNHENSVYHGKKRFNFEKENHAHFLHALIHSVVIRCQSIHFIYIRITSNQNLFLVDRSVKRCLKLGIVPYAVWQYPFGPLEKLFCRFIWNQSQVSKLCWNGVTVSWILFMMLCRSCYDQTVSLTKMDR